MFDKPTKLSQYLGRTVVAKCDIDSGWPCGMPGVVWRASDDVLCVRTREPGCDVHYSANARLEDVEILPVNCTENYVAYKSMQQMLSKAWKESEGHCTARIEAMIAALTEDWDKLPKDEQRLVGTRPVFRRSWEQLRPLGTPLSQQLEKEIAEFQVLHALNGFAALAEIPVELTLVSMVKALAKELRRRKEIQGIIDDLKTTPDYLVDMVLQPFIGRTLDAELIAQLRVLLTGVVNHARTH
jgi:hypothetical protein